MTASIAPVTNTNTTTDYRAALGQFADIILPHLMGEGANVVTGLTGIAKAMEGKVRPGVLAPGITLFPYQWAGVDYALAARRAVIGYGMGLGKTPIAITAAAINDEWPLLFIVPPTLRLNWQREFAKFAPNVRTQVLRGTKVHEIDPTAQVVIIGHATVKHWEQALIAHNFQGLVIDESQNFKNYKAQRTVAARNISKWLPVKALVLLLSGTFIMNTPDEASPQFQILGVMDGLFGGVGAFMDRYYPKVGMYEREVRNLTELHARMIDSCYCRLTFDQVRSQMGDKAPKGVARQSTAVEMTGKAATDYRIARDRLRTFLLAHHTEVAIDNGETLEDAEEIAEEKTERSMRAEALVQLNALRRLAGQAKIESTIEFVQNIVDQGEQVIVFAWHRDVVKAIAEKFDARTIMGGGKDEAIEEAKARFQAGTDKVIVLNIKAGGTGHTLTAANNVVFAEFPWTPTDYAQCEARADRIGQTELVTSHALLAANGESTIDEALVDLLNKKAAVVGQVLDGKAGTLFDRKEITNALLEWAAA